MSSCRARKSISSTRPWPLLQELSQALFPTWHEAQLAGRLDRHIDILRGIAHELSTDKDRPDRPQSAQQAQKRFEAHLENLDILTPRAGLAAPTGDFIDDLIKRYGRYGKHLFFCFDDERIPSTSNDLEGFFVKSKQVLRHALGCGNRSNSVVSNLGMDCLLGYHQMQQPGAIEKLVQSEFSSQDFLESRARLAEKEEPMIAQRSKVRHFDTHLDHLDHRWFQKKPATEP